MEHDAIGWRVGGSPRTARASADHRGARYSIAFFAQANREVTIAGPNGKYPPISAKDYLQQRISANFAR